MSVSIEDERVGAYFDTHTERFRSLLTELVSIPSVSPFERDAQEWVDRTASGLGLQTRVAPSDLGGRLYEDERFIPTGMSFSDRPNVSVSVAGVGAPVVLNAHIDVVANGEGWNRAPGGEWEGDRFYGRGSCDAKGSTIAALMAMACLAELGLSASPVILHSVVDEEPGGNGTLAVIRDQFPALTPRLVIVMEPSRLDVLTEHRGMLWYRFRALGSQGHGSTRDGISAIEKAASVVSAIGAMNETTLAAVRTVGRAAPSVTVGTISGGTEPYTTPAECVFEATARYSGDERDVVDSFVRDAAFSDQMPGNIVLDFVRDFDAAVSDGSDAELSSALQIAQQHHPGAGSGHLAGTCDMRHYRNVWGTPTVVFGPGDLSHAHGPDEFVEWAEVVAAARIIIDIARKKDWKS